MQNKAVLRHITGIIFLVFAVMILGRPALTADPVMFQQDQLRHVINDQTGQVSVYHPDGTLFQAYAGTGAGPEQQDPNLPMEIIRYLLVGGKGSISGLVWNDLADIGIRNSGEYGIEGVRVFADINGNGFYDEDEPSGFTDAAGQYRINRLKRTLHSVRIDTGTLPRGYEIVTGHPVTVDLAAVRTIDHTNFGVQDLSGKIHGSVHDQNEDIPIAGAVVVLDLHDNAFSVNERFVTTDSAGNFLFSKVPGGDYFVYVDSATLDAKYNQTPVSGGDPALITMPPGGSLSVDFSYAHKAAISGVVRDADGNIMAYVTLFIDLNGNGVYDAGEPIAMADQNGYYIFDQLFPGTYTVLILEARLPVGYEVSASPGTITIKPGDNYTADCTTVAMPVSIAGHVWEDADGNRVREQEENGLPGITVFLDNNNNGFRDESEPATATDEAGSFFFTGLKYGEFYIRVDDSTLQDAYIPTTKNNPVRWTLAPGQSYEGVGFGYQSKLVPAHTLHYPARLAWGADGKLYVSDSANNSVFIHDSNLNVLGELKGLAKPREVIADGSGNIYVGNQGRKNVEVYNSSGSLIMSIGDGNIEKPNGLALDRDNNIYVLDSARNTVLVYDRDGEPGTPIGDALRIKHGVSMAINYRDDGTGSEIAELYVADQQACAIHVFGLDGAYKVSLGACGTMHTSNWDGMFAGLMAVDIDQYGNIHGLDNNLNVVQVFDPRDGSFVRSYNGYPAENEYILNLQADIAIHPVDNRVVMANAATRNIETIATVPVP